MEIGQKLHVLDKFRIGEKFVTHPVYDKEMLVLCAQILYYAHNNKYNS